MTFKLVYTNFFLDTNRDNLLQISEDFFISKTYEICQGTQDDFLFH